MTPEVAPLLDLTLRVAVAYVDPETRVQWIEAMPLVLGRWTQLTPADYWNLTVAEHLAFMKALETPAKRQRRKKPTDAA